MRPTGMMQQRHVPGLTGMLGVLGFGLLGFGLLGAALAGCGSVVASSTAAAPAAPAASTAPPAAGCAAVNQATKVVVHRVLRVSLPIGDQAFVVTQRHPAAVQALLRDLCAAVTHPSTTHGVMHCPADFGTVYAGTFYDGSRVIGSFIYAAGGCRGVTLITSGQSRYTLISGPAAAAAPHLTADLAAVLGVPQSEVAQPSAPVNPGGPEKPA
jgi:hypothetical protein